MGFIAELKRRNVIRVAAAYLVAGWLAIQIVETVFPAFGFGDAAVRGVVIVLAVGLIPAIVFAWAFEITSTGIKQEKHVDRSQSLTPHTGKKLDRIIIAGLVLALAYLVADKFLSFTPPVAVNARDAAKAAQAEGFVESYGDKSIAVLPFVDMSLDGDQEYMGDGLAEELLNLLAKIPTLRVISRSSSFSFKGKDLEIPEIAERLNVAHVLEGSVRKSDAQLRITAQLIDARTDTHLWSETYDRNLDNIFAIQDEISAAVVEQLKLKILGDAPTLRETSPEAYALYLQANHLSKRLTPESLQTARTLYKQVLEIDPDYVPAWLNLSGVYYNQAQFLLEPTGPLYKLANEAIDQVIRIAPDSADARYERAELKIHIEHDLAGAVEDLQNGVNLEPDDWVARPQVEFFLVALGRLEDAAKLLEYHTRRDPVNQGYYNNLGVYYRWLGQFQLARERFATALSLNPEMMGVHYELGVIELQNENFEAAFRQFEAEPVSVFREVGLVMVHHAQGQSDLSDSYLNELIHSYGDSASYYIAMVKAYRNEPDEAFDWLEKTVTLAAGDEIDSMHEPLLANLHGDPRWPSFLERIGRAPAQLELIEFRIRIPE